jgi:hypothetical protein
MATVTIVGLALTIALGAFVVIWLVEQFAPA